ncbi:unnamed protein product [Rotaria sp. Silwood2]|nr:unnamed protein product [Rotaria sp. Silwood2]
MDAVACRTASPNTIQTRRRIVQNYLLIWIDGNIDEANKDCQNTIAELRKVVNDVNTFTQLDECVDFLTEVNDGKAFLIIAGAMSQHIVPLVHDIARLDAIYIFRGNEAQHKEWPKVQGVFTEIQPICESLKKVAFECDNDAIPMSFVPNRMMATATALGQKNLNHMEPSFMYSVLFKEIILEIHEDDAKSIKDLVAYCHQQNISESKLEEFQREYHKTKSIWWYTRSTFLYSMLNKALRLFDIEAMTKMSFFIRSLHQQLEDLHKEQSSTYMKEFIVYRGQGLSHQDFEHLLDTKGGLLSFNNFLSTSKKQQAAMLFVQRTLRKYENMIGVLFIMTIDPGKISASTTPFALIDDYSAFPQEQEILFSMHTVFRVGDIKQMANNNRLWEVQLTLTNDNDPQLAILTEHIQRELIGSTGWYRLAHLMLNVGHFNSAEELYDQLLKNASTDIERAFIYHQIGEVKRSKGQYKEAISFNEKFLKVYRQTHPENDLTVSTCYNNIAISYENMGDYSKALEFYEKALTIRENALPPNHPDLATSYNNIGGLYNDIGEHAKTLEFYEKSLKIREKALPSIHPDLATSYNSIGLVYNNMGDYSKALQFYEKAYQIYQKALPPNHPVLATICNNIGLVSHNMGNYLKALEFYEKAHKIYEKALPPNHPELATSYGNIGGVYNDMAQYSKALEFYERAHKIFEKALPSNHPDLGTSYNNVGGVYSKMSEYSKALQFYEKAHKIFEKVLPLNHPDLATSYNNIGGMYKNMDDYTKALQFYEKSHEIIEKALPPDHPHLAGSYTNIGGLCISLGDFSKALAFLEKALAIYQKSLPSSHPQIKNVIIGIDIVKKKM